MQRRTPLGRWCDSTTFGYMRLMQQLVRTSTLNLKPDLTFLSPTIFNHELYLVCPTAATTLEFSSGACGSKTCRNCFQHTSYMYRYQGLTPVPHPSTEAFDSNSKLVLVCDDLRMRSELSNVKAQMGCEDASRYHAYKYPLRLEDFRDVVLEGSKQRMAASTPCLIDRREIPRDRGMHLLLPNHGPVLIPLY